MPEILTRHPEIVISVLESGGAQCGEGLPQTILSQCPPEAFCALPGGEICVYGVEDFDAMTQLDSADLAPLVCTQQQPEPPLTTGGCALTDANGGAALIGLVLVGSLLWRRARAAPR